MNDIVRPPRPATVTVIAWLFIGFGALALVGGLFGLVTLLAAPMPTGMAEMLANAPRPFLIVARVVDNFWALALGQVVVGAAMVGGGIGFLRLEPWARTLLEVLTWIGLAYNLALGAFWMWAASSMGELARGAGPERLLVPLFIGIGIAIIIGFSTPLVVILRVLRGSDVRLAMRP